MSTLLELIAKQKEELAARKKNFNDGPRVIWMRIPKTGVAKIRVLPHWSGQVALPWVEVFQHWNVSENFKAPLICPQNTPYLRGTTEPCAICAAVEGLKARKDPSLQEYISRVRAKQTWYMSVLDLNDKTYTAKDLADFTERAPDSTPPFKVGDPKVKVYAAPLTVHRDITEAAHNNAVDVTDLENGHDFMIAPKPKGASAKFQEYSVTIQIKSTKVPYTFEQLKLPNLEKAGVLFTNDKMRELMANTDLASAIVSSSKQSSETGGSPLPVGAHSAPEEEEDLETRMRRELER